MSLVALYHDSDVLVAFLLVIDLGIFFILITFVIHLSKFLVNKNYTDITFRNLFYINILFFFLFLVLYVLNFSNDYNFNKMIENIWFFYISYYNYYDFSTAVLNSDMQLYKEIYFHLNNFEFFIVSIGIYFGIITSLVIFNLINKSILKNNLTLVNNIKKYNRANSTYFSKYQDIIKQIYLPATTRIWSKHKKWF